MYAPCQLTIVIVVANAQTIPRMGIYLHLRLRGSRAPHSTCVDMFRFLSDVRRPPLSVRRHSGQGSLILIKMRADRNLSPSSALHALKKYTCILGHGCLFEWGRSSWHHGILYPIHRCGRHTVSRTALPLFAPVSHVIAMCGRWVCQGISWRVPPEWLLATDRTSYIVTHRPSATNPS